MLGRSTPSFPISFKSVHRPFRWRTSSWSRINIEVFGPPSSRPVLPMTNRRLPMRVFLTIDGIVRPRANETSPSPLLYPRDCDGRARRMSWTSSHGQPPALPCPRRNQDEPKTVSLCSRMSSKARPWTKPCTNCLYHHHECLPENCPKPCKACPTARTVGWENRCSSNLGTVQKAKTGISNQICK